MKKILKVAALAASVMMLSSTMTFAKKAKDGTAAESSAKKEKKAKKEKAPKAKKEKKSKGKKGKFDQEAYDAAFAAGDYATCISMLQGKGDDKNIILDSLDADMLMHLSGNYLDSAKGFMETQGVMQQKKEDTSAGKAFAAAIAGENSVTYTGNVYERILAYSMRAANALALGDVSNAKGVMDTYTGDFKAELAELIAEQKELEAQSEGGLESDDVKNALSALKTAGGVLGVDINLDVNAMAKGKPAKYTGKGYEESAFLAYLGVLAYAANGDPAHANDFEAVLKTVNPKVDVSEDVNVPAGMGRLDVVALSGTIGKRSQGATQMSELGTPVVIPVGDAGVLTLDFKFAYPVFGEQNHAISGVRVTLNDGTSKSAALVEDFDEAVKIDVAQKASGAYSRSIVRNIVKTSSAIATLVGAKQGLDKVSNPLAKNAAQIAVNAAVEGVKDILINAERADIRQASYFPHKASAAGFTVAPGTYSVKVEYLNGNAVVETKEIGDVVVEAGKPTVVLSSCEK